MSVAIAPRTMTIILTTEPDPVFCYGQRLRLKRTEGKVVGMEYISPETKGNYAEGDNAPDLGWHYSFAYDNPGQTQDPTELFSEAQLLQAIA